MNREAIYSGLFDKLSSIPGLKTKSRILKHWTDVKAEQQPALFMAQVSETAQTVTGQPTKWKLQVSIYLYVQTSGGKVPGTVLNPIIDSISDITNFVHPVTGKNTLGLESLGVDWCRIEGTINTDEGTLGQQSVAIIPITILVS